MRNSETPLAAVLLAFAAAGSALAAPKVELGARERAFGEAKAGTTLSQTFDLRNAGDQPLFLKFRGGSAPGITARAPREVAPGASAAIVLDWDTSRVEGESEATVEYSTNDPAESTLSLTLTATLWRAIAIDPYGAVFFSVWRGESAEKRLTIRVREGGPTKILRLVPEGTHFSAAVETVAEGREYVLVVRVPAAEQTGRFQEHVVIETDHAEMPTLRVAVNVLVKPELYAGTESVEFGELDATILRTRPGLVPYVTQTFVVRRKEGPFELRSIRSDLSALVFERDPASGPSDAFRIDVRIDPAKLVPGVLSGSIRVETSDPRFPEISVPVSGSVVESSP